MNLMFILIVYYFLTRLFTAFVIGIDTEEGTDQTHTLVVILVPIAGDIFFLAAAFSFFVMRPILTFFNLGRNIAKRTGAKPIIKY